MQDQMKIGIIGCGTISRVYFGGAQNTNALEIKSCADIRMEAAQEAGDKWGMPSGQRGRSAGRRRN